MNKKFDKKIILKIILLLILIISAGTIFKNLKEHRECKNTYEELKEETFCTETVTEQKIESEELATEQTEQEIETGIESNLENMVKNLKQMNSETVGYILFPNMDISYPICQTTDNEYYLKHDFNKDEAISGCIFLDNRNKNDFSDFDNWIYGHCMRIDNSMFCPLNEFMDVSTYNENPYFYIITEDEIIKCEIFSCYQDNNTTKMSKADINTTEDFENYISYITQKSVYNTDTSISENDKIVSLMTCTNPKNSDENMRMIIHAKIIRQAKFEE